MALTKITVRRAAVTDAGTDFLTLEDVSNRVAQAVGVVDENGDHSGIAANPLQVAGSVTQAALVGTNFNSGGTGVDSALISASAADLLEVRAVLDISVTVDRYLMLFDDADGVVADGTAPIWRFLIPAGGMAGESFDGAALEFTAGITAKVSSTPGTLTVTADAATFITAISV